MSDRDPMTDGDPETASCPRCGRPFEHATPRVCPSCGAETGGGGSSPVAATRPAGSSRLTWVLLTLAGVLAAATLAVVTPSDDDTDGGAPAGPTVTSLPDAGAEIPSDAAGESPDGSLAGPGEPGDPGESGAPGESGEPGAPGEMGDVVVIGEDLPAVGAGEIDAALGMKAPRIEGYGFDGTPVAIDVGDRVPKAIVFLAHWCPHCQAEVPRVQGWLDGGGGVDGVEIVSVATAVKSGQPNYPPSEWLDREGWTAPVLLDDEEGTAHAAYGFGGFPFWVFVDVDGRVVRRTEGELDIADLEAFLREVAQTGV